MKKCRCRFVFQYWPTQLLTAVSLFLYGCDGTSGVSTTVDREVPSRNLALFDASPLPLVEDGIILTSWNLQWFPGYSKDAADEITKDRHFKKVLKTLEGIDPDILCLQEIKEPGALQRLTEALPGHSLQVISDFQGTLEIAIISKLRAEAAFMQPFQPGEASDPPRGFAYTAFNIGGHMLAIYSVHLKSNYGGIDETAPKREESARQLVAHAKEMAKQYIEMDLPCSVILCGDFNYDPRRLDWSNDDTFQILLDAGFVWAGQGLPREETITWLSNGRYPDAAFDHFMVKPAEPVVVGRVSTSKTNRTVSDHRPLTVRIKLP